MDVYGISEVDTLGLAIAVIVHAANLADSSSARMLLAEMPFGQPSLEHVWADQRDRGERRCGGLRKDANSP